MTDPTSPNHVDPSNDDAGPTQDTSTNDPAPRGTPRPDSERASEGLSDFGVVSAGGHVGPEEGDQAADN